MGRRRRIKTRDRYREMNLMVGSQETRNLNTTRKGKSWKLGCVTIHNVKRAKNIKEMIYNKAWYSYRILGFWRKHSDAVFLLANTS